MAATTPVTQPVTITDTSLLTFHNQRVNAYEDTKKQIDTEFPDYHKQVQESDTFTQEVRDAGHQLQNGKVKPIPSQEQLEKQKTDFLTKHEQFQGTYAKLKKFAENIKGTIDFLQPVARSYADEQSLQNSNPQLYAETKQSEKICLINLTILKASYRSVLGLQDRMNATLNGNSNELTWSLQRFCQIVDNKGQPLPFYSRGYNYFTTPVLPKIAIPKSNEVPNDLDQSFILVSDEKPKDPLQQPENPPTTTPSAPPNSPSDVDHESVPKEESNVSTSPVQPSENPSITSPILPNNSTTALDSKPEESKPAENLSKLENLPLNPPPSSNPAAPDPKPKAVDTKPPVTNASKQPGNPSPVVYTKTNSNMKPASTPPLAKKKM